MDHKDPKKNFETRRHHFESQENKFSKKSTTLAFVRIVVFLVMVILVVYFANLRDVTSILISTFILGSAFVMALKHHNKIQFLRNFNHHLKNINDQEISRLNLDLKKFDSGDEYIDKNHPYSIDLDLFGKSSLFQMVNRSVTSYGRDKIAQLLQKKLPTEFIVAQQEVIKELSPHIDWRQEFQASGMIHQTKNAQVHGLMSWIASGQAIQHIDRYTFIAIVSRALSILAIGAVLFGYLDYLWLIIPFVINSFLIFRLNKTTNEIYNQTEEGFKVLKVYQAIIKKSESAGFTSPRWQDLNKAFVSGEKKASDEIKLLENILNGFDARNGMMYHILNLIVLLDYHWVIKIERWKLKNCSHINFWFEAIGEIEAIVSLAGFSYANPDFVFPKIIDAPHHLKAMELGHPLIAKAKRVNNDFGFTVKRQITLVTGSNMSGKSTFLRTVGVNMILALAGAPVCAREMEVSNMDVFTGMRTQDNLEENISSFYAELTRIRQLLELLGQGKPVLFMLDEILKGTNSKDRHKGAVALTKQLSQMDASGFISTHDIELSYLENQIEQVKNYSFESEIREGELFFDYKIKKGVTESFNASILMEKIGIEMGEE